MTDNEINVAIAELCGWKMGPYYCMQCRECVAVEAVTSGGYHEKCGARCHFDVPNYSQDLNAMSLAEQTLQEPNEGARYRLLLAKNSDGPKAQFQTADAAMCHATARQRAEAFIQVRQSELEKGGR